MTDLKVAALALAKKGIEVFPLDDSKKPICKNGFHDATTDPAVIREFPWSRAGGIGQAIKEGTFVVDIDPRSSGNQTIETLKNAGLSIPETRVHGTRGGGTHRFYQLPTEHIDARLRGKLGPGVDIKAAGKGYVVVPPSPGYNVIHNGQPQPAPQWMIDELVKPPAPDKETSFGSLPKFFDVFEDGTSYGRTAMESEIGRLLMTGEGERNNALNRAAFSLAQLTAGGELKGEEALDRLKLAGERMGLESDEIEMTVESGWNAGLAEPREAPLGKETQQVEHGFQLPADHDEDHFWLDWENADDTPPPFYLHPIIPKNAYIIVYGATEASKSMVFLGLCVEASKRGVRSSVYSLENPAHIDIDRVRRLGPNPDNFRISNQMLDLNDPNQVNSMIERETSWPGGMTTDLLVIDTYSHAFNTRTEDGNAKAIEFARRIRYIMHKVGCSVILVDHTGYSDHGEPRDASAKRQQVDMAIKMDKVGNWVPGEPARWSMECTKSARFGNPFFMRGRVSDVKPGRGLRLEWDAGYDIDWRTDAV